ncbi:bifunctional DNA primase/polymerase [Mycobacterium sp.]|uniref:bifunctional DNA primase/polymerase n=1 Tax=Mycobacterium sp. TaxID=1785 RepID=UPI003F9D0090
MSDLASSQQVSWWAADLINTANAIRELGATVIDATDIGVHAVEAAINHWAVFPCHGKAPAIKGGRGVLDATTDVDQVVSWWSGRYRGANIGARVPASMFVLDVDGPHRRPHPGKGLQALAELENRYGPLPATFTQITGSGGLHLFFYRPPGKLSKAGLPAGLEYKDHGGYVLLAPSIHPDSGERYVRCDHPVIVPPAWLVDLIAERPRVGPPRKPLRSQRFSGPSIADEFTAATSWADVLMPHGWACRDGDPDGDGSRWLHPTATSNCSATISHGCLFVYSPNTPFDVTEASQPKGYTKFRAYAVLNHNGDMKAAARALRGVV